MADARPRLRRIEHPLRLIALVTAIVVAVTGSFLLGRLLQAPSRDALVAAQQPIPVTAEVELRTIDDAQRFSGTVQAGDVLDVFAFPGVVTRVVPKSGSTIRAGALLARVSGFPVYAMAGPLPLYRDLSPGDRGDDVKALQQSLKLAGLKVDKTGTMDAKTYAVLRKLIRGAGGTLAWGAPIPARLFLPIPRAGGALVSMVVVGTHLDADTPLLSMRVSTPSVTFRADAVTASELAVGDVMTVQLGETAIEATVARIGDFDEGTAGSPPGRDIVLTSADEALTAATAGSPALVSTKGDAGEPVLAVPVTALRHDDDGDYVEVDVSTATTPKLERVDVTVLRTGGGWVAVDGDLTAGDEVRVS